MKTFFGNTMGSKNQIWREKLVLKKWFPNKLQSVTLIYKLWGLIMIIDFDIKFYSFLYPKLTREGPGF